MFPDCKYYGVDISKDYNNDEEDFTLMEEFYELDLTQLDYSRIKDASFDLIIMSHIIEHLHNGDKVIDNLIPKLKSGGIIYLEYPASRSTKFPGMNGTLNFFDDKTHVRIYTLGEIYNLLIRNNVKPLQGGTKRNFIRILVMPLVIPLRLLISGKFMATDFWDLLGFAEYVVGRKI